MKNEKTDSFEMMKTGGKWLGTARTWLQWNKRNGDSVTWGSDQELIPPFTVKDVEELASTVASEVHNENLDKLEKLEKRIEKLEEEKEDIFGVYWQMLQEIEGNADNALDKHLATQAYDLLNRIGLSEHRPRWEREVLK